MIYFNASEHYKSQKNILNDVNLYASGKIA